MPDISIGILVVSDRSARGEREDLCAPVLTEAAEALGWRVAERAIVPDEVEAISSRLMQWCDGAEPLDIVLTSGGTGLGPRDVTPEATRTVIDREIPGLAERIRRESEKTVPAAVLSRAVCGQRKRTLVLNLPGSPKGAKESFAFVAELIPHALHTMRGGDHPHAAEVK